MIGPDLVVLGNLILDDVVLPDGATRMGQPGGAALYVALGARLWRVEVGLAAVVGEDYPREILAALADRGIDLGGVRRIAGSSLRTWLLYEGRRRRVVHRLDGPTHAEVSPQLDDLPAGWRSRACHLAPMPLTHQRKLAAALARRQDLLLSLDPFELVRREALPRWRELIADLDLLFLSEDEMRIAGALADPGPALRRLAGPPGRMRHLLYKQGARGGLALDARAGRLRRWQPRPAAVVDPTGAGDAFAGGFLAGRLLGDDLARALARAVVSAGFALEAPGAAALMSATPDEASERLRASASP